MATQQEITKLQEQAQELVSNLGELYKQVESYQSAKDELQKASSRILDLVESTKQLSEESHQIIKATNQIGSAKILEKLTEITQSLKKTAKIQMIIFAGGFSLLIVLEIVFFYLGKN